MSKIKYIDNPVTMGHRIRNQRAMLGITQDSLAKTIGVDRQTVNKWENDKADPSLQDLRNLSRIFACDMGYLLGEHECKTKDFQGIVDYTGLSEDSITTLSALKWFEKVFLEKLLNPQSRLHLYELSDSYTKYKEFVDLVSKYGIDGAEIPDSDMMDLITDENKMAYMRFKLSDSFLRFVDDSTK